jgi:uncharacterized protein (UPF0335 family)
MKKLIYSIQTKFSIHISVILLLLISSFGFKLKAQNVGVDVASPQQKLDVNGALRIGTTTVGLAGSIRWTGSAFEGYNGTAWVPFGNSSSGTVSGNGTINYIPKWGSTSGLVNSLLIENGTNIGIGTSNPAAYFHVYNTSNDAIFRLETPSNTKESRMEFWKFGGNFGASVGFYPGNATLHLRTLQVDPIVFEPNSVEAMRIETSGNVGIGSVNPVEKLDVVGSIKAYNPGNSPSGSSITLSSPSNDIGIIMHRGNGAGASQQRWDFKITSDNALRLRSQNSTDYFAFTNSGNLGIGTNTPTQKLDVIGSIKMVDGNQAAGRVMVSDVNGKATWTSPSSLSIAETDPQVSSTSINKIPKWNGSTLTDGTITDNGNVGIGTTAPAYELDVVGSVRTHGSSGNYYVENSNGTGTTPFRIDGWQNDLYLIAENGGDGNPNGTRMIFSTAPSNAAAVPAMVLDNNGNLGVGNYPSEKLEVSGKTKTTSFQLTTAPTDGFVLQTDALGNGTWVNPTSLSISESDPQVSSSTTNKVPKWNGTTLADGTIFDNGNIGIGTTNPTYPLHVASNQRDLLGLHGSGTTGTWLWLKNTSTGGVGWRFISTGSANGEGPGKLIISDDLGGPQRMVFDGNGNIGIGSASPTQKLDVNGKTRTTTFQMTSSPSNGYILQTDANGNGTWVNPTSLSITETDPQVASSTTNLVPKWNGTSLTDGSIYDNGSVGIGTNNPSTPLHVYSTGTGYVQTNESSSTIGTRLSLKNTSAGGVDWQLISTGSGNSEGAGNLLFLGGTGVKMSIKSADGNVGIGTSTPQDQLHVAGSIRMVDGNQASGKVMVSDANGKASWVTPSVLESDPQVSSTTTNYVPKWNGTTLTDGSLFDNGNIGIGTNSPSYPLQISSSQRDLLGLHGSGTTGTWLWLKNTSTGGVGWRFISTGSANGEGPGKLIISDDLGGPQRMVFDGNGNIGIGSASPTQKLDVNGKTRTTTFQMTNAPTAGYILQTDASGNGSWVNPATTIAVDKIIDADGDTKVEVEESPNENKIRFDLDGTEYFVMNKGRIEVKNTGYSIFMGDNAGPNDDGTNNNNVAIGNSAMTTNTSGGGNIAIGSNTLSNANSSDNIAIGENTLWNLTSGTGNTAVGKAALVQNTTGNNNTALGLYAGFNNNGSGNVFIGNRAGENEGQSNKLYIANSNTSSPLIYGDFSSNLLTVNGNLGIGSATPAEKLDVIGKTRTTTFQMTSAPFNGYVLQTDASGNGTWVNPNSLSITETDPHVSSTTTNSIPKWNGTSLTDGTITDDGNVGIGSSNPSQKLDVAGKTRTTTFQMTSAPTNGYVLQTDATGNGTWVNPTSLAITEDQSLSLSGTTLSISEGNSISLASLLDNTDAQTLTLASNNLSISGGNSVSLSPYLDNTDAQTLSISGNTLSISGGNSVNFSSLVETDPQVASVTTNNIPKWNGTALADGSITDASGNIGIGTNVPTQKLQVQASATGLNIPLFIRNKVSGDVGNAVGLGFVNENGGDWVKAAIVNERTTAWGVGSMHFLLNNDVNSGSSVSLSDAKMTILNTGNIGIGTTAPASVFQVVTAQTGNVFKLHNPTISSGNVVGHEFGKSNSTNNMAELRYNHVSDGSASNYVNLGLWGNANALVVTGGGNVGIGSSAPSRAKLEVIGSVTNTSTYGFLNASGNVGSVSSASLPWSIYASARIAATEFNAYSDARIKNIKGVSNSKNDLNTLMKIEITNYNLIDTIEKGNNSYKKVIAQQVEEVYPQAVSTLTDVIPNIYKLAEIKKGKITVANALKAGDKVKLIFENRTELVEVLSANARSFEVALKDEGQVFVYGIEVNDFHTVDYEALSTLNISATQELFRKIERLEMENADLKADNLSIKAENKEIKSDIDRIKASLNLETKACSK